MLLRDMLFLDGFAVLCADYALLIIGSPALSFYDCVIAITPICIYSSIRCALLNCLVTLASWLIFTLS